MLPELAGREEREWRGGEDKGVEGEEKGGEWKGRRTEGCGREGRGEDKRGRREGERKEEGLLMNQLSSNIFFNCLRWRPRTIWGQSHKNLFLLV